MNVKRLNIKWQKSFQNNRSFFRPTSYHYKKITLKYPLSFNVERHTMKRTVIICFVWHKPRGSSRPFYNLQLYSYWKMCEWIHHFSFSISLQEKEGERKDKWHYNNVHFVIHHRLRGVSRRFFIRGRFHF